METLADRITWVIRTGRVRTASAWSEEANLARTYLATYLARSRAGTPSDMGVLVLQSLAKAAKVNFTWLAIGLGEPDDTARSLPVNLQAHLKDYKGPEYPEALVRQAVFVRELIGEQDLPKEVWLDYLEALRREARRVGLELAASKLERRGIVK